ncbi:MAG: hemerythrin domain-containing protein [Acidobacteriia bacterium]|nr:hemerythrin domain-containing protein [Terriglobia bacterium]
MRIKTIKGRDRERDAGQAASFLDLLNTHHDIFEVFLEHQEALLRQDFPLALRRLKSYERKIKRHIREEEGLLMPVYSRAGKVPGGDPQLFLGEHQRIVEFIDRLKKLLPRGKIQGKKATRQAIEILYQEAMFRWLIEHHDEREKQILYPTLDRVTTAAEREEILKKVVSSQLSVARG